MMQRSLHETFASLSFPSPPPSGDPLWYHPGCSDRSRLTRYLRQTWPSIRGQGRSGSPLGGGAVEGSFDGLCKGKRGYRDSRSLEFLVAFG